MANPQTPSTDAASSLSAPVGPGQPNKPDDMALVRHLLNRFIALRLLPDIAPLAESGGWDASVASALKAVEVAYFFGAADPNGKLENDDTLFDFLRHADLSQKEITASLSVEAYQLATHMVPGGADWTKRITEKKTVVEHGRSRVVKSVRGEKVSGHIRSYLPPILRALTALNLNDTDMLMMALGTVRAETAGFRPISEGVSRFNTSPVGTPGRHAFDLYDHRPGSLGNDSDTDGDSYKGRGFVQLTGKANYQTIGTQIGVDLVTNPDLANDPEVAAKVLARFLKNQETAIRAALKANNLALARKKVNGGSHGLSEFVGAFTAGRRYLGIAVATTAKSRTRHKAKKPAQAPLATGAGKPAVPRPATGPALAPRLP